jgi:hypothetical protein
VSKLGEWEIPCCAEKLGRGFLAPRTPSHSVEGKLRPRGGGAPGHYHIAGDGTAGTWTQVPSRPT